MLKCGCIFDHGALDEFYASCGIKEEYNDYTMYFCMYEDGELLGVIRMYPENGRCRIEDVVSKEPLSYMYEEFIVKSCINFALTFNVKELVISAKDESFLKPMGFERAGDEMIGNVEIIDFPHPCCGKGANK